MVVHAESLTGSENDNHRSLNLSFSNLKITPKHSFVQIDVKQATSYWMQPGNPMLPIVSETFIFPFGTKIEDVTVQFSERIEETLERNVLPASAPLYISTEFSNEPVTFSMNQQVYQNENPFPEKQMWYRSGTGLFNDEHVLFVTVFVTPMQYFPVDDTIVSWKKASIDVKFSPSENTLTLPDEYDLLILSPSEFSDELKPLVEEKEAHGIKTHLVTLENISNKGIDVQEDIKFFIKAVVRKVDEMMISSIILSLPVSH